MKDISEKIETLRTAIAHAVVTAKKETIERAVAGDTPKGEVLPIARAAAVLAAKKTAELIPYCHPLALDAIDITFENDEISPLPLAPRGVGRDDKLNDASTVSQGLTRDDKSSITVMAQVKSIGRTGVEMEALTAASIAALTIYDMLKGIDCDVVIGEVKLLEKHGGKSDFVDHFATPPKVAVLVTSDSVSQGKKTDKSGKIIVEEMKKFPVTVRHFEIVPDEKERIKQRLIAWTQDGIDVILTTGGTGLSPRDVTVEAAGEIIERPIPGIAEAMRAYGQRRTPLAMLSRGVVGMRSQTLIITLPGSSKGVKESIAAIFPHVLHALSMARGGGH